MFSLYGARQAPAAEQLVDIDTLIYDIQDIGCRFYTYISTLGHVLEAASAYDVGVVVLYRSVRLQVNMSAGLWPIKINCRLRRFTLCRCVTESPSAIWRACLSESAG